MALSRQSYVKARQILEEIASPEERFLAGKICESKDEEWITGYLLLDNPHNDGYEAVWTNIENPTQEQIDLFHARKQEVPNSSIFDKKGDIVCFGWF